MQFVLIAHDRADGLAIRKQARPDHLAYLAEIAAHVVFAGPMIDEAGNPCGSILIYEAVDQAMAETLIANDPYTNARLFGSTELRAFSTVVRDGVITP